MFPVLSIAVTAFLLLCSFGIVQFNWFKMPMLEKRDLYWWYEWFALICLCFLNLSGEKHIIKKCCFISKITFHTWIYFVSFWNCLRPLVRLIFKLKKTTKQKNKQEKKTYQKTPKPTGSSTFFFLLLLLLLLLLEIFIACSYDIKSTRNNFWLPYLYYLCCRSEFWLLLSGAGALQNRLAALSG